MKLQLTIERYSFTNESLGHSVSSTRKAVAAESFNGFALSNCQVYCVLETVVALEKSDSK